MFLGGILYGNLLWPNAGEGSTEMMGGFPAGEFRCGYGVSVVRPEPPDAPMRTQRRCEDAGAVLCRISSPVGKPGRWRNKCFSGHSDSGQHRYLDFRGGRQVAHQEVYGGTVTIQGEIMDNLIQHQVCRVNLLLLFFDVFSRAAEM